MKYFLFLLLLSVVVITAACMGPNSNSLTSTASSSTPAVVSNTFSSELEPEQSSSMNTSTTSAPQKSETWGMMLVWNISTVGVPFMDMSPDGSLSAVVDSKRGILYLVKPDGESVAFNVGKNDEVAPVISGVAVKDGITYVLATYEKFAGVRKYSWAGPLGEERHGWAGSVADNIARSPSGNHLCYLITPNAGKQELYCDGNELNLASEEYEIHSVSDSGVVVLGIGDKSLVLKEGNKVLELETMSVIAYRDKLLASEDGKLRVYSLSGDVLAEKEGYTFKMTTLMRWTLIPTGRYIFRNEPLEDTSVLTWNLREVKRLPGFPYFANDNFVVMDDGKTLHCYSLEDFHEVFSIEVPDDIGYVKLSDDGKVLLVSGDVGGFWLYRAETS